MKISNLNFISFCSLVFSTININVSYFVLILNNLRQIKQINNIQLLYKKKNIMFIYMNAAPTFS